MFEQTSGSCPEQYDVYNESGEQVAYVRLRSGFLRVDCPDCGCETIYTHEFDDGLKGCFDNDSEKYTYINKIIKSIVEYYGEE